jgi:hypothetical protein
MTVVRVIFMILHSKEQDAPIGIYALSGGAEMTRTLAIPNLPFGGNARFRLEFLGVFYQIAW